MAILFNAGRFKATDKSNNPIPGAFLSFYATLTSTPQPVYSDFALSVLLTNPVKADSNGLFPEIWLDDSLAPYKVVFASPDVNDPSVPGSTIWSIARYNTTFSALTVGQFINPQTPAEAGLPIADFTRPVGSSLRYGLIPNDASKAATNVAILRTLVDPGTTGITGRVWLENTTGNDTYYFNAPIPLRDHLDLDLNGCTLQYTGSTTSADANSGLLFGMRNLTIRNGTIKVAVDTSQATSSGYAIQIGARTTDSSYFTFYDSTGLQLGNVLLQNLKIQIANTGGHLAGTGGIGLLGGIQNLLCENVEIDGNSTASGGIVYEFGWATNEAAASQRQTSHANNMRFRNIKVTNLDPTFGVGIILGGAYNCSIDGLRVVNAASTFTGTPGESLFYRPWVNNDVAGAKRTNVIRNVQGFGLTGIGMTLTGASAASGSYLSAVIGALSHPADYAAQTNLADYVLDGFVLVGLSTNFGVLSSATRLTVHNGRILGFQDGILLTDECAFFDIDTVKITGCGNTGINLNGGAAIWSPTRLKVGTIRNCLIINNSVSSTGAFPGIQVTNTASLIIESNRLNAVAAQDGADETTQGSAVALSPGTFGVVCRANYIGVILGGSGAYFSGSNALNGNSIEDPRGVMTTGGGWNIDGMGQGTSSQVSDKTSNVNTYGKYFGRMVYDSSNTRIMVAQGPAVTDTWKVADGSATVTPS